MKLAWYGERFEVDHATQMEDDPDFIAPTEEELLADPNLPTSRYLVWCNSDDLVNGTKTVWTPGDPSYLCAGRDARNSAFGIVQ